MAQKAFSHYGRLRVFACGLFPCLVGHSPAWWDIPWPGEEPTARLIPNFVGFYIQFYTKLKIMHLDIVGARHEHESGRGTPPQLEVLFCIVVVCDNNICESWDRFV